MGEAARVPSVPAIRPDVAAQLSDSVYALLADLPERHQAAFSDEFMRRRKTTGKAFLWWFLFGLHYAYLGQWGWQVAYWLTLGGFGIWAIVDLFRLRGLVRNANHDLAMQILGQIRR